MDGYNRTREVEQLLQKTQSSPPSFIVHLHAEHWVLNNGSKFLYNNQIASLLDDIRLHRIPVDFLELFDSARVPFYDGIKSQEPALKTPQKTRVVLHPNPETLWSDICSLNQRNGSKWTDRDALEVEAKIILATAPPLCLDPDPHLTRVVNHVMRVSTPSMPLSLKRKAATMEPEENGPEKAKRERVYGIHGAARIIGTLQLIDYWMQSSKQKSCCRGTTYVIACSTTNSSQLHAQSPAAPQTPAPAPSQSHSPADLSDNKTQN
ncbi:hypothetical protein CPB84DRAFT_1814626 [Gymnopilus junonius]|uniref:Spt20-like SEP domain-containing protein n=1 Tax=Gymnopilus junonius TaxID=109634 RepID=A0A9P5NQY9_GYMJU|nr:hypothetical protein CPB84DRAFT_1814626 [Gymnopilus junonius]